MFITYKTINLITGEYYIGSHKTDNLDDGYLGSGRFLRKSIEKYGVENHKREILGIFDTRKESLDLEHKLIKEKKLTQKCILLNQSSGGQSFDWINEHKLNNSNDNNIKAHKIHLQKMKNDTQYNNRVRTKISLGIRNSEKVKINNFNKRGKPSGFLNKEHSQETKLKISLAKKGKNMGINNSQFGSYWITNGNTNIKWSDNKGNIPNNYYRGRVIK